MEGNRTEWTVPAQLRRCAEERPDDIAHRLVDVDDLSFGRWNRESNAAARGLLVQPLSARPHRTATLGGFTADGMLAAIGRQRPTDVALAPAMAIPLVTVRGAAEHDLSSVRQVRTTSAPIHPATLEALAALFPMARIRNVYSTTECWPRRLATDFDRDRPGSLGRPPAGAAMEVTSRATEELGREIMVRDLLDATSLRAFAVRVDAAATREAVGRRD
jgi:acyl-CoA synthetase (AMP-forming)/AMP-acid ligase II